MFCLSHHFSSLRAVVQILAPFPPQIPPVHLPSTVSPSPSPRRAKRPEKARDTQLKNFPPQAPQTPPATALLTSSLRHPCSAGTLPTNNPALIVLSPQAPQLLVAPGVCTANPDVAHVPKKCPFRHPAREPLRMSMGALHRSQVWEVRRGVKISERGEGEEEGGVWMPGIGEPWP